jgi:hypothetical protein
LKQIKKKEGATFLKKEAPKVAPSKEGATLSQVNEK